MLSTFLESGPLASAFLAITIVAGLALIALFIAGAAAQQINAEAFVTQINKLLRADNAQRGMKLCEVAGQSAVGRLVRVGLDAFIHSGSGFDQGVEQARIAMNQQLPLMLAPTAPRIGIAIALGAVPAVLGAVVLIVSGSSESLPVVGVGILAVAVLAGVCVRGQFRVRETLNRVVATFGAERSGE